MFHYHTNTIIATAAAVAAKGTHFMNANKIRYAIYEGNIQSLLLWVSVSSNSQSIIYIRLSMSCCCYYVVSIVYSFTQYIIF